MNISLATISVCPRDGPRLSQGRVWFVPDTVPHKMFMFTGIFLSPVALHSDEHGLWGRLLSAHILVTEHLDILFRTRLRHVKANIFPGFSGTFPFVMNM